MVCGVVNGLQFRGSAEDCLHWDHPGPNNPACLSPLFVSPNPPQTHHALQLKPISAALVSPSPEFLSPNTHPSGEGGVSMQTGFLTPSDFAGFSLFQL